MTEQNKLLNIAYNSPELQNINNLIIYFNTISGKNIKLPFIRQKLFKTSWKSSELKIISRCHVQAAVVYLNHLMSIKKLSDLKEEIQMIIAEIVPYIRDLDVQQDTSFIITSCNTLPSFAHYLNAQELFYNHNIREDYRNNYDCDVLVLYALRLTLEKRINSIIGIDFILDRYNKPISLSKMIKIVQNLKRIEFSSSINWVEIESVNKWLNHFMHRNLRPYPWVIHQSFETLNNILNANPYMNQKRVTHSWYSSTIVKSISEFEKEIQSTLENEFPNSKVKWLNEQELLIIS